MVAAVPALTGPLEPTLSLTFTLALVVLLALAILVALLFDIRNNTRRTAEAVERLADQRETDESDP
ncbi:hypothetical protein SAMN05216388_100368 [Halorientalis persicus]|jgi:uncharacterized protein involved in exopolysaccharide biosynthesis|uniref:Uncharacterized protein n=1 Tax=Halorientalis persicus TaxID=1367881 RepID=A0A1H8GDR7_9EURY|nr:hypothetical protein [Halorientalis persicus]SEN41920.1 hypothetical protein SAMN05216388_100368 [Halorientalis persicus]